MRARACVKVSQNMAPLMHDIVFQRRHNQCSGIRSIMEVHPGLEEHVRQVRPLILPIIVRM